MMKCICQYVTRHTSQVINHMSHLSIRRKAVPPRLRRHVREVCCGAAAPAPAAQNLTEHGTQGQRLRRRVGRGGAVPMATTRELAALLLPAAPAPGPARTCRIAVTTRSCDAAHVTGTHSSSACVRPFMNSTCQPASAQQQQQQQQQRAPCHFLQLLPRHSRVDDDLIRDTLASL